MQSHLVLLVLFAGFVSVVFAAISKEDAREQVRFGALLFAGFVVSALALGWLMVPFPL
jgi:prepilin signal peptidase PulO-like enzyme (type II secretory pathway)